MRKLMLLAAFVMLGAATAFGYTFPGAFVYDGLITYDHLGMPLVPNALHFNVGAGYMMWNKAWKVNAVTGDNESVELKADNTVIAVPIDVGYAINERILVDVTLQVLSASYKPDTPTTQDPEKSATGLGDVWVKGRYLVPVNEMFNLGGRLGVKVPVGKVDYTDTDLELGDDQMDIDVAAVAGIVHEEGLVMGGQLGFRYRMDRTVTVSVPDPLHPGQFINVDQDVTPGMMIYLDTKTGYSFGQFDLYVPLGFEMTMANKTDDTEVKDSETNGLYLGLAPAYALDANNTLGIKFLYPVMGQNVPQSMLVGVTYEGYIPM
jgi:hypothetical protein